MRSWIASNGGARVSRGLLTILAAAALATAACAPSGSSAVSQPQDGGRVAAAPKILRFDSRYENTSGISIFATNTASQRQTTWAFHAGLTAYDAQSKLVGRLAAKVPSVADGDWKVNPDGTMDVTWKLRPNAMWHDGTPLTAADVAFGYELYLDKELPVQRTGGVELVRDVTVSDPQTLVVHWKQPYYNANVADLTDVSPVPVHILGEAYRQGDKKQFINHPYWTTQFVGLGPYRLGEWVSGAFMEGLAFDNYVLGRPRIDRVVIRFNADPNVALAGFLASDLDLLPAGLTVADRDIISRNHELTVLQWPSASTGAIWQWRDAAAPWVRDLRVRQAHMHLLDRQLMADTFAPGGSGVAHLFVAPTDPVYRLVEARGITKYPYDPNRAALLLTDAGWTRGADGMLRNAAGQGFPFEVRDNSETKESLSYIDMLRKGGIDASLYVIPQSAPTVDRQRQRAESQGVRIGGSAISDEMMIQFTAKEVRAESNNWSGLNQGGYVNPDLDRQYDQFLVEFDSAKRDVIYADFHKFIIDEILRIPWYYESSAVAYRADLRGPMALTPAVAVMTWNIHEWDLS